MNRTLFTVAVLIFALSLAWGVSCLHAAMPDAGASTMPATAAEPENPLGKLAARPLFRDPVYNNPTDPVIAYNNETKKWFMYYTQRRGGSIALIHGSKIGIATSDDHGATWQYMGTADITYGQDQHPTDYTYWAPEVFSVGSVYHMFLTYVPGIFDDWKHPREIVHLTSKDGIKWDTVGQVDLKSEAVIDPCVYQLPDGTWRMFYKDERKPKNLWYADSPDLDKWEVKGNAVTDRNGEGPNCVRWQGKYWLVADTDTPAGQGIWSSDDCTNWKPQASTLYGSHGDIVVNGDRAWWFYFGGQRIGNINWAVIPVTQPAAVIAAATTLPTTTPARGRGGRGGGGISINVVELKVIDGKLMYTDPTQPVYINLGDAPKVKQ